MDFKREGYKMKKNIRILLIILLPLMMFFGCKERTDLTGPQTVNGNADFTRFVTIGNSLTAGYQSSALYESAQQYSFGNLIAQQVGTVFVQPLVSDPGLSLTGGRLEVASVDPFVTLSNSASGSPLNTNYAAPYNNLGIPSAYVYDVLNAINGRTCYFSYLPVIGQPIPFFDMVLRGLGTQFQQARALHPTFLALWIGSNDALIYASSGGLIPFTPVQNFTAMFNQIADSIASLNCKVAVANIPRDEARAFIETVGGQLLMAGVPAVWAVAGTGDTVLMDLTKNFVLLTATSELYDANGNPTGVGFSQQAPLSNQVVLDENEFAALSSAIDGYNNVIRNAVNEKGFALVDLFSFFKGIKESEARGGTIIDGIRFATTYVTGNLISLDGLHPTNQGQAIIANEFIKSINLKFNANIPLVDVANIPGSLVLHGYMGKVIKFPKKILMN
jgi:lysophospholipase L1-like esterase